MTISDLDGENMARAVSRAMCKATILLKKAADDGDAEAQFSLGLLYLIGRGVDQNPREAFKLFRLAERSGFGDAAMFREVAEEELERFQTAERLRNEAVIETMMEAKRRQLFPGPKLVNLDC